MGIRNSLAGKFWVNVIQPVKTTTAALILWALPKVTGLFKKFHTQDSVLSLSQKPLSFLRVSPKRATYQSLSHDECLPLSEWFWSQGTCWSAFVTPAGSCDSTYDLESHLSHSSDFRTEGPDVTQLGESHPGEACNVCEAIILESHYHH